MKSASSDVDMAFLDGSPLFVVDTVDSEHHHYSSLSNHSNIFAQKSLADVKLNCSIVCGCWTQHAQVTLIYSGINDLKDQV